MPIETRTPVVAPPLTTGGEGRASIGRWFKRPGEAVSRDEPLVEIEFADATQEVRAPVTGVLSEVLVVDGASVRSGTVLGTIITY